MGVQRRLPPYVYSLLLAVVIAAAGPLTVLTAPPGRTALGPLGDVLLVVGGLALAPRQRAPIAVVWITSACALVYLASGYPGVAAAVPVMIALYTAVRAGHRKIALVPLGTMAAILAVDLTNTPAGNQSHAIFQDRFLLVGWLIASAMMGGAFRQWEAYVKEAEQRAAEAELTREETARRRAVEERLRIARELHDSLTHSISIIKVQAGVAIHLARKRGEQVPEALLAVQEAGGEAMRELRATLEVLRDTEEPTGHGLDKLPELIDRNRAAGLSATIEISGQERRLPAAIERAAFRIVQEALTNVSRHAGPAATASVLLSYDQESFVLQIEDDGLATAAAPPTPGVGLSGMRERVTALGGSLLAAPRAEGGFTVRVVLPLESAAQPVAR